MSFLSRQWDVENYPSSEDYLDARQRGTVAAHRNYLDKPAGASPDIPRAGTIPNEPKYRNPGKNSPTTAQPKPFLGSLGPTVDKKQPPLKIIIFIIALAVSFLPSLSKILDSITDELNLKELLPFEQKEATSGAVLSESSSEISTHITTSLPFSFFKINSPLSSPSETGFAELDGIESGKISSLSFGIGNQQEPFFNVKLANQEVKLLELSPFKSSEDASKILNPDGTLVEGSSIELVFTDLTGDGLKDALVYYYNGVDYPFVEIFHNTATESEPFKPFEYFESYEKINITTEGILQRIDGSGNIYDEIEVTPDGVFLLEGGDSTK